MRETGVSRAHGFLARFEFMSRMAVLGCGSIGSRHLRNLLALGARELIVYDPVPTAREKLCSECTVDGAGSLDGVWAFKPKAVLITSPTGLHLVQAMDAIDRGCHVFLEKPLAHSLDRCDELIAKAEAKRLTTMVACNMRFHPGPAEVKRLLSSGILGTPLSARIQTGSYLPKWRPFQDYRKSYSASVESGGIILDAIHEIDLALWYLGPAKVEAALGLKAESIGLQTDGLAEILLRHNSGAISSLNLNYIQRDYKRGCQIVCTDGTIYWDFTRKEVSIFDANCAETHVNEPEGWQVNQMYLDEMRHFLSAVENETATCSPFSHGVAALEIALEARRRVKEGFEK